MVSHSCIDSSDNETFNIYRFMDFHFFMMANSCCKPSRRFSCRFNDPFKTTGQDGSLDMLRGYRL